MHAASRSPGRRRARPPPEGSQVELRPRYLAAILALPLAAMALLSAPEEARTLPLFSRSLSVPCAGCHDVAPNLNAAGMAFAQRGYRLDAHESEPGRSHGLPLSVVASAGLAGFRAELERPSGGPPLPRESARGTFSSFELVAAGTPAARISGHLDMGAGRSGVDFRDGQDFLQFSDLLPAGTLAIKAGRFDAELPFLSHERRLTMTAHLSPIAFAARGLELDGARSSWTCAAGLSLSERTHAGGASPRTVRPPLEDTYFRLGRSIGAQSVAAQMLFDRQDSDLATLSWLQHLRLQVGA